MNTYIEQTGYLPSLPYDKDAVRKISPNDPFSALVSLAQSRTPGKTDYRLFQGAILARVNPNSRLLDSPPHTLSVSQGTGFSPDTRSSLISPYGSTDRMTTNHAQAYIEIDARDKIQSAYVQTPQGRAQLQASFRQVGDVIRSSAQLRMSLVPNCTSLTIDYDGNDQFGMFDSVHGWSAGQVALVFQDGIVPDIDFQRLLWEQFFLGNLQSLDAMPLPKLTFDPRRYYHGQDGSWSYLVRGIEDTTEIQHGSTVEAVKLTDATKPPYRQRPSRVSFEVIDMAEVDYEYRSGPGKATVIKGNAHYIDGYSEHDEKDLTVKVRASMDYVLRNPVCIPGSIAI